MRSNSTPDEGNFDLVGNNIPVFFIQDAIKFPDLIHSVKMEPDRGYPQDATAHDTFWDFISLLPESMNMVLWIMSDRTIPRSLRMMEGFGIHTFRLVNADGKSTFVKFHWRPTIGSASVVWDEAVKINGADPDFHRRDLYEAIAKGAFPEWEFGVQAFDEKKAESFDFDVLDPTKIIPGEVIPIEIVGRMVLDRNPVNFFAETEQAAFHPGHVVPGIDFTNDPLLQGRLFSYTDTQISRLGGANFHELPINRPRCPMRNLQRDGMSRMDVNPGRVAYEPNSLDPSGSRENPDRGFRTFAAQEGDGETGQKLRIRSESFADHYSQARQFYRSMSVPEQRHIQNAFAFELSKVETPVVRRRMLGHLALVDETLAHAVEVAIGMEGERAEITPYRVPVDLNPSPALSLVGKAKPMLKGRKIGALVTDGADGDRIRGFARCAGKRGGGARNHCAKDRGRSSQIGEASGCRYGAFWRALRVLRRSGDLCISKRDQAAPEEQRCYRLDSRRVRAFQSHWAYGRGAASIREGGHGGRSRRRRDRTRRPNERRAIYRGRKATARMGPGSPPLGRRNVTRSWRSSGLRRGHLPFADERASSRRRLLQARRPRSRRKGVRTRRRL